MNLNTKIVFNLSFSLYNTRNLFLIYFPVSILLFPFQSVAQQNNTRTLKNNNKASLTEKTASENSSASTDSDEYIYHITDYTPENGLAGSFVNYTHKDSRGLFWIGTQSGLHRFDGREFKVFDEAFGLPFNQVMEIYEDSKGWLWLYRSCRGKEKDYCFKDLAFFHHTTHEVKSFEERFGLDAPFKPAEIEFFTTSPSNNKLTITTTHNPYLWTGDGQFKVLPLLNNQTNYHLIGILDDGKMGIIQRQDDEFHYQLLSSEGQVLKSEVLIGLEDYKFNRLILGSKEIGDYNFNQYYNRAIALGEGIIYRLSHNGDLILHEYSSIFPFQHKPTGNRHTYFDEKNQSFWAAGRGSLRLINLEKKRFRGFKNNSNSKLLNGLSPISDQEIFCDFGLYNFVNNSKLLSNTGNILHNSPPITRADLKENNQLFIFRIGLFVLDDTGQIKSARVDSFFNNQFFSIHTYLKRGQLFWFGTDKGLWSYDLEKDRLIPFQQFNQFTDFVDCYIHDIQAIGENDYWIATNKGLFRWHLKQGIVAQYSVESTGNFFIPENNIYHLLQKEDNTLWLATREGLVHLTLDEEIQFKNGQHYVFFTKKDGLLGTICVAVYEDDFGYLWVATDKGLVQFDLETSDLKVYTTKEGLLINYFREYNHFQSSSGELIFGGIDGLVSFHPKDFKEEVLSKPEVPIIIVDYEQYNPKEQRFEKTTSLLLNDEEIILQPGIRLFNLKVCLEDYRNAKEQRFAYRIKGYQDEWQEDQSNLIRITGLPYGKHELEIMGRLADGRFSNDVLLIPISVLRPFYLQWWFFLLIVLALLTSIFFGIKYRTRSLKRIQAELEYQVAERTATIEAQAEKLRNLDKMKTRFFANVSHELRTPLTLILGPLDSVLINGQIDKKSRSILSIIQRNGQKLGKLINQILDLGKLDAAKMQLNPSNEVLYLLCKRLISAFESKAEQDEIELGFDFELPKDFQIKVDSEKVEMVLNNLLSNALKFTTSKGKVIISVKKTMENIVLSVNDTGRGIHPNDIPYIFDRYYQTSQSNTPAEGGTGIGLALCHEIAKLMEGKIWVESTLGEGSRFVFEFPAVEVIGRLSNEDAIQLAVGNKQPALGSRQDSLSSTSQHTTSNQQPAIFNCPTLLLVEDNHDLRAYIKSILETDYEIIEAQNGKEAMEWLTVEGRRLRGSTHQQPSTHNPQPSLIVTDLMMPVMDGFQLVEELKSNASFRHLPIIVLTARAEIQTKINTLRIGVDDYMLKPFVAEELIARVENLLANSKERQVSINNEQLVVRSSIHKDFPNSASNTSQPTTDHLQLTTEEDLQWLKELEEALKSKLESPDFKVDELLPQFGTNRSYFFKKIKRLTGLTPNQHLKEIRLHQARQLLETQPHLSVKALAYSVGFKSRGHFTEIFKKRFGKFPSDYVS